MKLLVFQSMWAMEELPWRGTNWSLEEQVERIAAAGFDGAAVEFEDYEAAKEITRLLRERDLLWSIECAPRDFDELRTAIVRAEEFGLDRATHINLQPNVRPQTVLEGIPLILEWQRIAGEAGLPVLFETHRDRMTTDLLYTLQLIEAIPRMELTADLSHYLLGREFRWPVSTENHLLIERILDRAHAFHGRVASREQVQIQLAFPHHRQWLDLFLGWWREGFRRWRARAEDGDRLIFTTELGPPRWYAISGPDGNEMSDRWLEALTLRREVQAVWDELAAVPA
jgi:sugar phosphate isomerase/epimerase